MEEQYFVIQASDGDVFIQAMSREALEKSMERDEDGVCEYADTGKEFHFRAQLDNYNVLGNDLGEREILIIKGHIIVPKPVEVVAKFAVE